MVAIRGKLTNKSFSMVRCEQTLKRFSKKKSRINLFKVKERSFYEFRNPRCLGRNADRK
jgi:hypothetical protein